MGVIVSSDSSRVAALFDGESRPKIFAVEAGSLERVVLPRTVVRRSTGKFGIIIDAAAGDLPRWLVAFDAQMLTIAEADLRPHVLDDPQIRLREGRLGSPRRFCLAVTARRYELEQQSNDLITLGQARVDIKPHQVSVAHRVVSDYPHRYLLCDEVGLGKTIEAGMVLKELRARGGAQRALVISPPNLIRQWQFELKSKFNEVFSIINTETVRYMEKSRGESGNPFLGIESAIVSSAWITSPKWAKYVVEVDWDLVIIDEAHHARARRSGTKRVTTSLYRLVSELVSPDAFSKRAALFLTATPMQLDSSELYSLIEILDPALFPTEEHFAQHRLEGPVLSRLVNDLSVHGFPVPNQLPEATAEKVGQWLDIGSAPALERLLGGPDAIAKLCQELSDRHLLSQILIRNRKSVIGGFMPRRAHRWPVVLTDPERAALEKVEDYVLSGYAQAERNKDTAIGFVMTVFQKLMASSLRALRQSLDGRRSRLEERSAAPALTKPARKRYAEEYGELLDNEDTINFILADIAQSDANEVKELEKLVRVLDEVPVDSKAEVLVRQLKELQQHDSQAKVLLFTQFRETQSYLAERLTSIGWRVFQFHGQLKVEAKDQNVEDFRNCDEPAILISTEAGGEGRNFQFCHLLVNYDLPWNPMRIEQRIGRVDRIGQDHVVEVFNLYTEDTIEERVLDVLERRINIFEQTVGGLDPILGDTERSITKALQSSGAVRDAALAKFEKQLERQITEARTAEERLRDFIMETRSYSGEIARLITNDASSISPDDLERFSTRLVADVNTHLAGRGDGSYELTFHEPFLSDYPAHTRDRATKRLAAFRADVCRDSEHVEYFTFGHPIIDDLLGRVTNPSYEGCATAFEVDAGDDLPPTEGWLVVTEIGVPAVKEIRELFSVFVHDDGRADPELGSRLVARSAKFPKDEALSPGDIPIDTLDTALDAADGLVYRRLSTLEQHAHEDSGRRIDRERDKLTRYFDYRQQAAVDRLARSQTTLAMVEASTDQERRKIIPVWQTNVARDERLISELGDDRQRRLDQLDLRATGSGDSRLVALARVEIKTPEVA
jgi:SNF2 family DNA or RNA helicase